MEDFLTILDDLGILRGFTRDIYVDGGRGVGGESPRVEVWSV